MDKFGERGIPKLNIASICRSTRALGPGLRAAIWVQGCPFKCEDCISPEYIPDKPAHQITPKDLADIIIDNPKIQGVTISGGEPMMQAAGLARFVWDARLKKDIDVICFSGFKYSKLVAYPPKSGIHSLLKELDVLIDGAYMNELNDNKGLRGSSNQEICFLSNRLENYDFVDTPRKVELIIQDEKVISIGVPPRAVPEKIQSTFLNRFSGKL